MCLDAGESTSFTSGQSWLDQTTNSYDVFLGATSGSSTDDPTFNGSAGGLSSSEYFSVDGADFFRYDTTNETWMQNTHKDNAAFTFLAVVYLASTSGNKAVWGTDGVSVANVGSRWWFGDGTSRQELTISKGSAALDVVADSGVGTAGWKVIAVSVDEAGGTGFFYLNGSYDQVSSSDTFTSTYATPSASSATYTAEIFGSGNGAGLMPSGSRIACFAAWSRALSKANLDAIYTTAGLKDRFGL